MNLLTSKPLYLNNWISSLFLKKTVTFCPVRKKKIQKLGKKLTYLKNINRRQILKMAIHTSNPDNKLWQQHKKLFGWLANSLPNILISLLG